MALNNLKTLAYNISKITLLCIEKKFLLTETGVCPFPSCKRSVDIIGDANTRRETNREEKSSETSREEDDQEMDVKEDGGDDDGGTNADEDEEVETQPEESMGSAPSSKIKEKKGLQRESVREVEGAQIFFNLYLKITNAEERNEKACHELIVAYYYYGEELEKRLVYYREDYEEHEALKKLYYEVKDQLPKEVTKNTIWKKSNRARRNSPALGTLLEELGRRRFIQGSRGIEEDPWISQNDLRRVVDQAIGFASNLYAEEPSRQLKLLRILSQNREIDLPRKLIHDGTWKETENELAIIAERILDTLSDSWNNPAFGVNFVESLNEEQASSINPEVGELLNQAVKNYIMKKERQRIKPVTSECGNLLSEENEKLHILNQEMEKKIEDLSDSQDQYKSRKQAMAKSLEESGKKNSQLSYSVILFKDMIHDTKKAIASTEKAIDMLENKCHHLEDIISAKDKKIIALIDQISSYTRTTDMSRYNDITIEPEIYPSTYERKL
ncbi:hypothetical protein C1645_736774 [Glomus cerebriforme]|uniref:Uncharacterized protein n=1 Tax=Glomus cerebriforme TaxID=658196 RepID=A0A397T223_9GLOM|nr:hypothetical protein C1645_736774 [Glomus cerebriforme]